MRTIFSSEIDGSCIPRTDSAQFLAETESRKMRFPKIIKHRRFEATIYGKSKNYPYYRVAYRAAGKRHLRNFKTFSEAKTEAERVVRDLADGSQSVALSANQSRDAITAFEMLEAFRQTSGRRVSLTAAISEFVETSKKLGERTLREAADGFLKNVAVVTSKDLGEAVKEFLQAADVRKDYLSVAHRLFDADGLRPEHANNTEVTYYSPADFQTLLDNADDTLRPLLLDKLPEVLSREQKLMKIHNLLYDLSHRQKLIRNDGNRRFSKWVLLNAPSVKQ